MARARRALRLWHKVFGLGAALWLVLLSATGSAIVFYDELDRWLNPDLRAVAAGPAAASIKTVVETSQVSVPGFTPRIVDLPNRPGDSFMLVGAIERGQKSFPAQVFVDPRDGALLGFRITDGAHFDRRRLMDTLYALHMDLMAGPVIAWFLGLVALLWAIDHVPAAMLAAPRIGRSLEALKIGGKGFNTRRLFDLHRAPGLWLWPVTLMLALTGVLLAWPESTRDAMRRFSPVNERLHYEMPAKGPPKDAVTPDQAIIAAAPEGEVDSLQLLPRQGLYAVRSFDRRDLDDIGRLWTYVDMADGRVVARRHDNGETVGDAVFAWQYPLHSGKAFGLAGRIAVLAGGIVTLLLCVSGLILWRRRSRSSPRRA
ncbi:PepSY-associated TM helix domain-containing protein [Caulobacter segnis]|uniref:PepSY-associated TM helix domain-containing protein n=1 Tax=Caulobacter segnis TaxID=88688 RepID=UPI00240EF052|nr:PepSY-associated TM helix domain-containing protein [Caulobacter segnis]MDG2523008.1 PepSY-associated TM helix domain-containing protein [Caulobacter segnis]